MERKIEIINGDEGESVQTEVNEFLASLPETSRLSAKLHFSTSVWDGEGVLTTSVLIDYEVR